MDMNNGEGIAWGSRGCWVEGGKGGDKDNYNIIINKIELKIKIEIFH